MKLSVQQKYMIGGVVVIALIGYGWWYTKKPQQLTGPVPPNGGGGPPGPGLPTGPGGGTPTGMSYPYIPTMAYQAPVASNQNVVYGPMPNMTGFPGPQRVTIVGRRS